MLKDIEDNLQSAYSLLSERGILGGLYFGIILFSLIISTPNLVDSRIGFLWILLITTAIGIIISNISYEFLMPLFRFVSKWLVLRGAKKTGRGVDFKSYSDLRNYRERFLQTSSNSHLKNRIRGHEKLRITLTYIACTNVILIVLVKRFSTMFKPDSTLLEIAYVLIIFVFIATLVGILSRAWSLGEYIGLGWNEEHEAQSVT